MTWVLLDLGLTESQKTRYLARQTKSSVEPERVSESRAPTVESGKEMRGLLLDYSPCYTLSATTTISEIDFKMP